MIVPAAILHKMPEHLMCQGSFDTGAVIVAEDGEPRYIRSIAKIIDAKGTLVGWVYLADDYGANAEEYVQANQHMRRSDLSALHVRFLPGDRISSVSILSGSLPKDLTVNPCYELEHS